MRAYVGRYAPSPTGDLHLGNALAAAVAWARARRAGGRIFLRMEDLDTPRVVPGAAQRIVEDLHTLGLEFDGETLVQSADLAPYHAALAELRAQGLLYACSCSRKELARLASAPHAGEEGPPYPGTCRSLGLPLDDATKPLAWRLRMLPGEVAIEDAYQGRFTQDVAREVGDVVVRRRDGVIPYQLAVVVDDGRQGITDVVRGRDLLGSAPRQVLLHRALGRTPPDFAHVPLWVDARGERLSKRSGEASALLRALFARGESGARVLGRIAHALGIAEANEAVSAHAFLTRFGGAQLARPSVDACGPS